MTTSRSCSGGGAGHPGCCPSTRRSPVLALVSLRLALARAVRGVARQREAGGVQPEAQVELDEVGGDAVRLLQDVEERRLQVVCRHRLGSQAERGDDLEVLAP